jgi:hypothetical protein
MNWEIDFGRRAVGPPSEWSGSAWCRIAPPIPIRK